MTKEQKTQNNSEEKVKELLEEIEKLKRKIKILKSKKKYGLVWEEEKEPEQAILDCQHKKPILKEVKEKNIITDKNKPMNILIEGENYHALSALNHTHKGKIDVIYIDPPYNTGAKDWKYNDRYVDKEDTYRHSKWLSFMNSRLKLAKNLLKKTGIIFISIDDHEVAQLKLLCDEIFGDRNFIATLVWRKKRGGGRGNSIIIPQTEYILIYSKTISEIEPLKKELSEHKLDKYKYEDSWGKYAREGLDHHSPKGAYERKTLQYDLVIDGKKIYCPTGQWLWSKSRVNNELKNYRINEKGEKEYKFLDIVQDSKLRWRAYKKIRLNNGLNTRKETILSFVDDSKMTTNFATSEIKEIFGKAVFNYSKPTKLIEYLIRVIDNKQLTILDFFAGSGTTGHAVLELNKEDGGNRQFILCTNNENNICTDVCYPRIEKVIKGYKNQKGKQVKGLGGNLRYFKTDCIEANKSLSQSE